MPKSHCRCVVTWLQDICFRTQPSKSIRHTKLCSCETPPTAVYVIVLQIHKFGGEGNDWQPATSHFLCYQRGKKSSRSLWDVRSQHQTKAEECDFSVSVQQYVLPLILWQLWLSIFVWKDVSWKLSSWTCFLHKHTHKILTNRTIVEHREGSGKFHKNGEVRGTREWGQNVTISVT